jgi:flagellar motor component MotA
MMEYFSIMSFIKDVSIIILIIMGTFTIIILNKLNNIKTKIDDLPQVTEKKENYNEINY